MAAVLDAPTIFQLTPGDGSVTIDFSLPDGSAFTDVLYATNGNDFLSLGAKGGPVTITKESDNTTLLVNDTTYSLQLVGVSIDYPLVTDTLRTPIAIFTPVATPAIPDPPLVLSTTPADGAITIVYTLGDNGGSAVTAVYYTTDNGVTFAELPGPVDGNATITTLSDGVTPITNDTQLTIQLVSVNAVNSVPANNTVTPTILDTPALVPVPADSPFNVSYTPGDHELDVSYKLGSDGGSDFISVYYSTDDGITWMDTGVATGVAQILQQSDESGPLVNGDTYKVRLLVTTTDFPAFDPTINLPSARIDMTPNATVVPPEAPVLGAWIADDQMLTVPYKLGSDGGSPVTNVYYSTDYGATWYDSGTTNGNAIITTLSSDGVTPLTNGATYGVQLVVTTAAFENEMDNLPSMPIVPMIPNTANVRPSVVNFEVSVGDASLGVTYSLLSTGGSPINYIYYSTDAGQSWADSGNTNGFFTMTNQSSGPVLVNGTPYYILLVASTVAFSDYLNNPMPNSAIQVTPLAIGSTPTPPSHPIITSSTVGDKTMTLYYTVPSDGGSPIIDVLYSTDGGTSWFTTGESYPFGTATITALSTNGSTLLTNGTRYYVQLVAVTTPFPTTENPQSEIQYLTPQATTVPPDAPIILNSFAGNAMIQIDYVLGFDGGSPVYDIQYSTDEYTTWRSIGDISGTAIITTDSLGNPLVNGTPYVINLVSISKDYSDPTLNAPSKDVNATPTAETSVPPDAPIITSNTPGNMRIEVFFNLDAPGSGTLISIWYTTSTSDPAVWVDSGVSSGSFIITSDSDGNPLVNGQTYNVRIVAVTSDYLSPSSNTPSESVAITPLAAPVAPIPPYITGYSPGDTVLTVKYKLGSDGGSYYTNLWYSTDGGSTWNTLTIGNPPAGITGTFSSAPIDTSTSGTISFLSTDGTTPLTNGHTYNVLIVATTGSFNNPAVNTPSNAVYMTPNDVNVRPSAPVITSWFGLDGALVVRYTILSDGGSTVTAVYYSTDGGLSWATTRAPTGTAVITQTSDGLGPIIDSITYGVRLVVITVDFPSLSNPFSPTVYMVARPTVPGTFKPKGMSYTEFLRSKKADSVKIIDTKPVRTASEITNARRLAASTVFALNNAAVKGSITNSIDFAQGGLHAARSYYKEGGTGRRVGSASEFTAFSGSQAIGGLVQAGLPPTRLLHKSNFILVSPPVSQGVGDYLRRDQGCKTSLGQQHDLTEVTPPKFVDNTVRNTGSPACVTRPAIHDIKAKNAFAYVPNRPSQAEGQYALKGDQEPGKDLPGYGGKIPTHLKINKPITTLCSRTGANPHYKAGAAIDDIPYVEKHHGNDLGVNPKRPFVKFQIPKGATPVHLKINKPVNTL
jgi:titin